MFVKIIAISVSLKFKKMIDFTYVNGLPADYEPFLIQRYNSFITNCRYIEIHYADYDLGYMLVHKDGELQDLFVFGNRGHLSKCFNSLTSIDSEVFKEFQKQIFITFPKIRKIEIVASYVKYDFEKSINYFVSDNHILQLPNSLDEYYSLLGAKTRKHIKARTAKLYKEFKQVDFSIKFGQDVDRDVFDKIIKFNCMRMKGKGKTPGINEDNKNHLYQFVKQYGYVVYLELDGRIVAGCISTLINKTISLHVIAHDNLYSKYNVGEVCAFHLIQKSMENKWSDIQFLWGRSELKRRFLAVCHPLYFYYIYRNYTPEYYLKCLNVTCSNQIKRIEHIEALSPLKNFVIGLRKKSFSIKAEK